MKKSLIVLGASVRAACQSARRAELESYAADCFADRDTQAATRRSLRARPYPAALVDAVASFPNVPWMYTGALENHPRLIQELSSRRTLWGNSADVVAAVRDPFRLNEFLHAANLIAAETRHFDPDERLGEAWLLKPLRGAAGAQLSRSNAAFKTATATTAYWQRWIEGEPVSALFVAAAGRSKLLGTSWQLSGNIEFGAKDLQYVGNIAPGPIVAGLAARLEQLGGRLAEEFQLCGLFGIDGVLAGQDFVPVEVNPRYTAAMEVVEPLLGRSLVGMHVAACANESLPDNVSAGAIGTTDHRGKAILYARQPSVASERLLEMLSRGSEDEWFADIPMPGESFPAGAPIVTALARGASRDQVDRRLRGLANRIYELLAVSSGTGVS